MNRLARDPLADTARLLVDGTNLLHAISRAPERAPAATLVGRLRAVIPASTGIEIVFDGPPDHGLRRERIAAGVTIRYAGGRSADAVLLALVDEVRAVDGPRATERILVVTDDRALRSGLQQRGARSAGSAWLIGRLERSRLSAPAPGNPRPPRPPVPPEQDSGEEGRAWRPGRGATTKRGNPRRSPKRSRPGSGS
jgi:predicted RNA-binding protein with PIN domain